MQKLESVVKITSPQYAQSGVKAAAWGAGITAVSMLALGYSFSEAQDILTMPSYIPFLGIASAAGLSIGVPLISSGLKEVHDYLKLQGEGAHYQIR